MNTTANNRKTVLELLSNRWLEIYSSLLEGVDVSPSARLRTEGVMEAAVLFGDCSEEEVLAAMDACHQQVYRQSLVQCFGDDWQDFYPFPQIPAQMQRAPVYPSTAE